MEHNIKLTHIINPHMFWYMKSSDPLAPTGAEFIFFQSRLQKHFASETPAATTAYKAQHKNEVVAVWHEPLKQWTRAKIDCVIEFTRKNLIECAVWLVDYGLPYQAPMTSIRKLPEDLEKFKGPEIYFAGLFGIVPITLRYCCQTKCPERMVSNCWSTQALHEFKRIISLGKIFFREEMENKRNQKFGELVIVTDNNQLIEVSNSMIQASHGMKATNFLQIIDKLGTSNKPKWQKNDETIFVTSSSQDDAREKILLAEETNSINYPPTNNMNSLFDIGDNSSNSGDIVIEGKNNKVIRIQILELKNCGTKPKLMNIPGSNTLQSNLQNDVIKKNIIPPEKTKPQLEKKNPNHYGKGKKYYHHIPDSYESESVSVCGDYDVYPYRYKKGANRPYKFDKKYTSNMSLNCNYKNEPIKKNDNNVNKNLHDSSKMNLVSSEQSPSTSNNTSNQTNLISANKESINNQVKKSTSAIANNISNQTNLTSANEGSINNQGKKSTSAIANNISNQANLTSAKDDKIGVNLNKSDSSVKNECSNVKSNTINTFENKDCHPKDHKTIIVDNTNKLTNNVSTVEPKPSPSISSENIKTYTTTVSRVFDKIAAHNKYVKKQRNNKPAKNKDQNEHSNVEKTNALIDTISNNNTAKILKGDILNMEENTVPLKENELSEEIKNLLGSVEDNKDKSLTITSAASELSAHLVDSEKTIEQDISETINKYSLSDLKAMKLEKLKQNKKCSVALTNVDVPDNKTVGDSKQSNNSNCYKEDSAQDIQSVPFKFGQPFGTKTTKILSDNVLENGNIKTSLTSELERTFSKSKTEESENNELNTKNEAIPKTLVKENSEKSSTETTNAMSDINSYENETMKIEEKNGSSPILPSILSTTKSDLSKFLEQNTMQASVMPLVKFGIKQNVETLSNIKRIMTNQSSTDKEIVDIISNSAKEINNMETPSEQKNLVDGAADENVKSASAENSSNLDDEKKDEEDNPININDGEASVSKDDKLETNSNNVGTSSENNHEKSLLDASKESSVSNPDTPQTSGNEVPEENSVELEAQFIQYLAKFMPSKREEVMCLLKANKLL